MGPIPPSAVFMLCRLLLLHRCCLCYVDVGSLCEHKSKAVPYVFLPRGLLCVPRWGMTYAANFRTFDFRLSVSISGFSIISNRVCKNEGRGRRVEGEHRDVGQVVPVLLRSPQSRHSEHAR